MSTLQPIPERVKPFWDAYQATLKHDITGRFYESFYFADSEKSANALAELVLVGTKRATACSVWALKAENKPAPQPGSLSIMTNWVGEPLAVLETRSTRTVAFDDVDAAFAATEGEGDGSLAYWRAAHWAFFGRECQQLGLTPHPQMPVLCEVFELVYRRS